MIPLCLLRFLISCWQIVLTPTDIPRKRDSLLSSSSSHASAQATCEQSFPSTRPCSHQVVGLNYSTQTYYFYIHASPRKSSTTFSLPGKISFSTYSPSFVNLCFNSHYIYVAVSKLQVAILARLSMEISQTVRIDWQYILSRVRVSVRPSNVFIREKHTKAISRPIPANVFVERAGHGRSIASDNMSVNNSDRSGERLTQNGDYENLYLHELKYVV